MFSFEIISLLGPLRRVVLVVGDDDVVEQNVAAHRPQLDADRRLKEETNHCTKKASEGLLADLQSTSSARTDCCPRSSRDSGSCAVPTCPGNSDCPTAARATFLCTPDWRSAPAPTCRSRCPRTAGSSSAALPKCRPSPRPSLSASQLMDLKGKEEIKSEFTWKTLRLTRNHVVFIVQPVLRFHCRRVEDLRRDVPVFGLYCSRVGNLK